MYRRQWSLTIGNVTAYHASHLHVDHSHYISFTQGTYAFLHIEQQAVDGDNRIGTGLIA